MFQRHFTTYRFPQNSSLVVNVIDFVSSQFHPLHLRMSPFRVGTLVPHMLESVGRPLAGLPSDSVPEVSRYVVTVIPVRGGTPVTDRTTDNSRYVNVTGLAPGTNYEFRVVAISEFGEVVGNSSQSEPGFANTTFTGMQCVYLLLHAIVHLRWGM